MQVGVIGAGGLVRIRLILATSILLLIPLAVLSNVTHSMILALEAYHMLYNVLTLVGCLVAVRMAAAGGSVKNTYGWQRMEVLVTLTSLLFLAALCFSVTVEAVQSIVHASHQDEIHHPVYIMSCAAAVLLGHLLCYMLVGGYTHLQSTFLKAAEDDNANSGIAVTFSPYSAETCLWRHFLRDLGGTLLAAGGAAAVYCTSHWLVEYLDPLLAIIGALILVFTSASLTRACCLILLQNMPRSFDADQFSRRLMQRCPQLQDVHELHVWQLTPDTHVATAHIVLAEPRQFPEAAKLITAYFLEEGVSQVTLQPEFTAALGSGALGPCLLTCRNATCEASRCCRAPPPPPVIKVTPPSQASMQSVSCCQTDTQPEPCAAPAVSEAGGPQEDRQPDSHSEASSVHAEASTDEASTVAADDVAADAEPGHTDDEASPAGGGVPADSGGDSSDSGADTARQQIR